MSKIIEIKKSQVAFLRGLNKSVEEMSAHYQVTPKEMKEVLVTFGFSKGRRKNAVEPAYVITPINDVPDIISVPTDDAEIMVTQPVDSELVENES